MYFMFLISVTRFVKEKLVRIPGDVAFMAAASSPTDSGAATGSMIGRGTSSINVNKYHANYYWQIPYLKDRNHAHYSSENSK